MNDTNLQDGYGDCRDCDSYERRIAALTKRITDLKADRDVAQQAIRDAPHGNECQLWMMYHDTGRLHKNTQQELCDCWKRDALQEAGDE